MMRRAQQQQRVSHNASAACKPTKHGNPEVVSNAKRKDLDTVPFYHCLLPRMHLFGINVCSRKVCEYRNPYMWLSDSNIYTFIVICCLAACVCPIRGTQASARYSSAGDSHRVFGCLCAPWHKAIQLNGAESDSVEA